MSSSSGLSMFGFTLSAMWANGYVWSRINTGAWQQAFALADDSGLSVVEDPSGAWIITYGTDASRKVTYDRGVTWEELPS